MWSLACYPTMSVNIYLKGKPLQRFYSSLLIIALLLTFVGQAVASVTMVCEMPHMRAQAADTIHTPIVSLNNDVTAHSMSHSMVHSMMKMDCCDDESTPQNDCSCPINGCTASSVLSVDSLFSATLFESEKVNTRIYNTEVNIPRSLYRPPMSA